MMRIGIMLAVAGALVTGGIYGANWLRKDAQADLLRELQIQQTERNEQDIAEREARKKEIENASADDLWAIACRDGMLPPDSCAGTNP